MVVPFEVIFVNYHELRDRLVRQGIFDPSASLSVNIAEACHCTFISKSRVMLLDSGRAMPELTVFVNLGNDERTLTVTTVVSTDITLTVIPTIIDGADLPTVIFGEDRHAHPTTHGLQTIAVLCVDVFGL